MQFVLIAEDGKDPDALNRRMAAREKHAALAKTMKEKGQVRYGAVMLDGKATMAGSVYIYEFPTRADLDAFLKTEPYVMGNVWKDIRIEECKISPLFS